MDPWETNPLDSFPRPGWDGVEVGDVLKPNVDKTGLGNVKESYRCTPVSTLSVN